MNSPIRIALVLGGILIGGWLLISAARSWYFAPRAEMAEEIESGAVIVGNYREALNQQPRVRRMLQATIDRTLGGSREVVDHELRSHLNRIVEQIGLTDHAVGTGNASAIKLPKEASKRFRGSRELGERIDFVTLEGWISGEGTLEQIVALIDRIEAQPWLKHITHVKLDPKDNGARLAFLVRLETLYLPGGEPSDAPTAAYDPRRMERFARLVSENIFRIPPPPEIAPPPTPAETEEKPAPPAFPWDDWSVTGIAHAADAAEVWLRNRKSGETRVLREGQSIEAAQLVRAEGEWAVLQLDDQAFRVQIGPNLSDRTPADQ